MNDRVDGTESGKHSMSKKYCRKSHHRCAHLDSILAKMKSKPNQMASKWKNVRKNWQIYWKQIKAIKSEQNFNQTSSKIIHNGFSNVAHKNAYILCMWLFCRLLVWRMCMFVWAVRVCVALFSFCHHSLQMRCRPVYVVSSMAGKSALLRDYHFYLYSFWKDHYGNPLNFTHFSDKCSALFYGRARMHNHSKT